MTDRYRVVCSCTRRGCPYRITHRKQPTKRSNERKDHTMARLSKDARTEPRKPRLSNWSLGYLATFAVMLVLAVVAGLGGVATPWWVSALIWLPMLLWTFLPMLPRPASWRVTDSRTTDGDERRPSWVKGDEEAVRRADALRAQQRLAEDKGE